MAFPIDTRVYPRRAVWRFLYQRAARAQLSSTYFVHTGCVSRTAEPSWQLRSRVHNPDISVRARAESARETQQTARGERARGAENASACAGAGALCARAMQGHATAGSTGRGLRTVPGCGTSLASNEGADEEGADDGEERNTLLSNAGHSRGDCRGNRTVHRVASSDRADSTASLCHQRKPN